jgi:UDP-4-amino-4-deoxy-L-arabinose-oxoglutarate aminotransferase
VGETFRDRILEIFGIENVGVTVNYRAISTLQFYKKKYNLTSGTFPTSENFGAGTLTIPLFPGMTSSEQDYVINVVKNKIFPLLKQKVDK